MRIIDVANAPTENEEQLTEMVHSPEPTTLHGIDPHSELHQLTMAELKRIKRYNPALYDKIVNLG